MKFVQARSGVIVRWYPCINSRHDYHASIDGVRTLCSNSGVTLLRKDPRPEPPPDPSRDPWTCPTCQEQVRRAPSKKPTPITVLNQALARAIMSEA